MWSLTEKIPLSTALFIYPKTEKAEKVALKMKLAMNGQTKLSFLILAAFIIYGLNISRNEAADVFAQNTLDHKVKILRQYKNRSPGLWMTTGWWRLEGESKRTSASNNVKAEDAFYFTVFNGKTIDLDLLATDKTTTS
jgi:uncharacterized membrane protein